MKFPGLKSITTENIASLLNIINKTKDISILDLYNNTNLQTLKCEIKKMEEMKKQCDVRLDEGKYINTSLSELITDIEQIIKKSYYISNNDSPYLPLYLDTDNKCYENLKDKDLYKPFLPTENTNKDIQFKSHIMRQLSKIVGDDKKVILEKINFVILNIIRTDYEDKEHMPKNNPPNPPYIYADDIKDVTNVTDSYHFYKDIQLTGNGKENIVNIKRQVKINNEATLIGTMETVDQLQRIIKGNICYEKINTIAASSKKYERLYYFNQALNNNYKLKNKNILYYNV